MDSERSATFPVRRERGPLTEALETAGTALQRAAPLTGVPTGVEGLDELFYTVEFSGGQVVKRSLGGYPRLAVVALTGIPETGKSLMAEQFAVQQAALGHPVLFITVETPAPFIAQALELRAGAMGFAWEGLRDRIYLIDAASRSSLREDVPSLLSTAAYAYRRQGIRYTVIDSLTGLYEAREIYARAIVREVYNFLKEWHQTAVVVTQKRSAQEESSAEAAGGYAVSHIVDCTIVLTKRLIETPTVARLYGVALGDVVRTLRIDGCRLSGHDPAAHVMEISELGLVRVGPRLADLLRGRSLSERE
jgi:KaiC domain protein